MPSMTERVARLEEQICFQEQAIAELNQALTSQQFQFDKMEKHLAWTEKRMAALLHLLEEGGQNLPPPHYGSMA